jgi:flagellar biosynthesis protein FlhB
MAEDSEDRTEAPTPRKREEAREQGQVVRSVDLTSAAMLMGFLMLFKLFGTNLIESMTSLMRLQLSTQSMMDLQSPGTFHIMGSVTMALAPILLGAMALAVFLNVMQTGFRMSTRKLEPNLGVLNPISGLGRLFSRDGLAHLVMNLLKMGLALSLAYSATRTRMKSILILPMMEFPQAFSLGATLTYEIAVRVAGLLLVLAAIDYGYERFRHEQRLKMTKQEVKEEMRHMEGDPKIKQHRRAMAMQIVKRRIKKDVPTADVIVTNPTHFAVALKYDAKSMRAPKVVAKGQDFMARRIREIAIESGIPIVERPPLARGLYKTCQVGHEIPESFYSAVAEILAYVYELSGKSKRKATA